MLQHPKTESWFVDALRSAGIMQKGGLEGQIEGNNSGGHESIFLDTSSSFGSTSSSVSLSNLPPIKANGEESVANLIDNLPKFSSPERVARYSHSQLILVPLDGCFFNFLFEEL